MHTSKRIHELLNVDAHVQHIPIIPTHTHKHTHTHTHTPTIPHTHTLKRAHTHQTHTKHTTKYIRIRPLTHTHTYVPPPPSTLDAHIYTRVHDSKPLSFSQHDYHHWKAERKRCVFNADLKEEGLGDDLILSGIDFQTEGAE